jgi:hypothetical protein
VKRLSFRVGQETVLKSKKMRTNEISGHEVTVTYVNFQISFRQQIQSYFQQHETYENILQCNQFIETIYFPFCFISLSYATLRVGGIQGVNGHFPTSKFTNVEVFIAYIILFFIILANFTNRMTRIIKYLYLNNHLWVYQQQEPLLIFKFPYEETKPPAVIEFLPLSLSLWLMLTFFFEENIPLINGIYWYCFWLFLTEIIRRLNGDLFAKRYVVWIFKQKRIGEVFLYAAVIWSIAFIIMPLLPFEIAFQAQFIDSRRHNEFYFSRELFYN